MVSHGNSSEGGSREGKSSRQQGTASPGSHGMKKGPWTTAEDGILMEYVNKYGEGNWNAVQRNSGLQRCGKSCRLRWANHLRPNLKKGAFSPEEERLILELHAKLGNKWARMASQLPGRTDNEIKNYWNTRVKRLQRAGLPIYPDDIHRQIHGQHQQFISPSSSSPFSSLISGPGPGPSNSNFGINPSLSAFFTSPGNFQTVSAPFHNSPLISHTKPPQFTIFRDSNDVDPNNNNYNPNVMPLVNSSSNLQYTHQNFHQKEDHEPTNPFQFNFDDIDHHHPNLFAGSKETELPSIQSPVVATPVSSSSAGVGDYQFYDDIVPHHEVANSGLLEALLEESKALLNKENSSISGDHHYINKRKEICGSIDEIAEHHDPSPAQSSISLNEKVALEEINPIDDDLSSLLNNFPLTVPVPDWYDQSVKNSNKQSSNISDVISSGSINNNRGQDSNVPALNTTPTSEEDDWSSLNPYCWNNMPGIC